MNDGEIEYYRAVEDHFALLRGTPFLFSPKDFAFLNQWWREGVPLGAVLAGLAEVFERRRERGDDPVSSLAYCRHAVARHAKRLRAARVGEPETASGIEVGERLRQLAAAVHGAAEAAATTPIAAVLSELARAMESLPANGSAAALDEALSRLEAAVLDSAYDLLPPPLRERVDGTLEQELAGIDLAGDARGRTRRALRRRAVREALGLPRLEL